MRTAAPAGTPRAAEAQPPSDGGLPPCAVTIVAHDIGPVRGMERQLTELLGGLADLGHPLTVIARTCELPPGTAVDFHRVRGPSRPFLLAYPWFMLAGSLAVRRRRRGLVQATGAIVLNRVDVVSVHYCHQVGTATPSRQTWPFRLHIRIVKVLKQLGERLCFALNRSAVFVCVSEGVADEIRAHFPRLSGRVLTIHNGIDTGSFTPGLRARDARAMRASLGIAEDRPLAAFVAGEWERKGLRQLIEALALAPEWDVLVAGGGDERPYRRQAASLGVADRIHWLGVTRDVALVYAMCDAFVQPTSYETFSLVTFEAAASGLPVVVTPVNGVRELVVDGENGFLVEALPQPIAERLRRLAADPALRVRLGAAAREAALAFDSQRMIARHHELYAQLSVAA